MTERILSRRDEAQVEPTSQGRLPRIGIMGEFSAGKTTFLNFLLGEVLLPTRVTATQIPPVWISYGAPNAILVDQAGHEHEIGLAGLGQVSLEGAAYVRLTCQNDLLHEFELIDTPGISDPNIADSYRDAMVGHLDGLIWCTHAPQAWRESERRIYQSLPAALREKSILLATRSDKLVASDRDRVQARLQREVGRDFRDIIMFSTFDAIRACAIEDGQALFASSGAEALMTRLRAICAELRFQGMGGALPAGGADASAVVADAPVADGQGGVVLPMSGAGVRPRRVQPVGQSPRHRRAEADAPPRPRAALKVVKAAAPLPPPQAAQPVELAIESSADMAADPTDAIGADLPAAATTAVAPPPLRLENPLRPLENAPAAPEVPGDVPASQAMPECEDLLSDAPAVVEASAPADQVLEMGGDAGHDSGAPAEGQASDGDDFAAIMAGFERLSRADAGQHPAVADPGPEADAESEFGAEFGSDMAQSYDFADGPADDPDDAPADIDNLAEVLANISRLTAESAKAATHPPQVEAEVEPEAEPQAEPLLEAQPATQPGASAVQLWQAVLSDRPVKSIADVIAAIGQFAAELDRAGVLAAARSAERD